MSERLTIFGLGDWLNTWGDVDAHVHVSREWKDGYEQAIRDVYGRFDAMFPDWPKNPTRIVTKAGKA